MLKEGQKAPGFTSINQNNEKVSLTDYKGKRVILYFYPEDNTPTCTTEACNLRDKHAMLNHAGYVVLGVSPDSVKKHQHFISKYNLPFDLLSDPDHDIINKYGVWGEKNMYGRKYMGLKRTTFIIDEEGRIEKIIKKVKSKEHAEQILKIKPEPDQGPGSRAV